MKQERGFTIVELLIVIVVIAILAAITIVAYNGVQNKARDTNNKTDAVSLVKVAESVNADEGSYPAGTTTELLTAAFNAGDTSNIPNDVTITYAAAAPTDNDALITAADTNRAYTVVPCGTGAGVEVFYPSRSEGAVQSAVAGTC